MAAGLYVSLRATSGPRSRCQLPAASPLVAFRDSLVVLEDIARGINLSDEHELAVGKLAELLARGASRDLFDSRELLLRTSLDTEEEGLGFVVYGGIKRVDWRTFSVEYMTTTVDDFKRQLPPMLRAGSDRQPRPSSTGQRPSFIRPESCSGSSCHSGMRRSYCPIASTLMSRPPGASVEGAQCAEAPRGTWPSVAIGHAPRIDLPDTVSTARMGTKTCTHSRRRERGTAPLSNPRYRSRA